MIRSVDPVWRLRFGQSTRNQTEQNTVSEQSKEEQRGRHLRSLRHHVGYEEQKQRKTDAAKRRSERSGQARGRRRNRDWDEDDEAGFEKIRRGPRPAGASGDRRRTIEVDGLPRAIVVGIHHGRVELDTGAIGRVAGHLFVDPEFRLAVGDEVAIAETDGSVSIQARLDRRTCLSRPDPGNPNRPLVIAANVDVAVIVVAAADPPLRPGLIDRLLLALRHGGVAPVICVNKIDLLSSDEFAALERVLSPYVSPGVGLARELFRCSASTGAGVDGLRSHLAGKTCVFVGHSGVGKSSILNRLDPDGARTIGAVRPGDGKGRHTTTSSSLRELADGTRVIDTPGVRSFGLDRFEPSEIRAGFPEFDSHARGCRYADCGHVHEPGCAVQLALQRGSISTERYASYRRILDGP
jgi:ribosome biogenesis GTPase / thiamine phosphate phosphatase